MEAALVRSEVDVIAKFGGVSISGHSSLPPEFLAQDRSQELLDASIALIVIQAVIFAGYVTARIIRGEGIGWVARILVPASYLNVLALAILGISE